MERIVLVYSENGKIPLRKWRTTGIIGGSRLNALRPVLL